MLKLLHSADWQLGLEASHVAAAAEPVRAARLEAARRVVAAAAEHRVDALVLAGDLFEDNLVEEPLVRAAVELLAGSPVPVFVLPGNHDPLSRESVYLRSAWKCRPAHIVLLDRAEPFEIPGTGAFLLPSPLTRKKGFQDPTERLPAAPAGATAAIGVAHGSLRIEGKYQSDDFPIALDAAEKRGLDYLALGHWHGCYVHGERTAYSGTHETTRFGEARSGQAPAGQAPAGQAPAGQALLVEVPGRGAPPRITEVRTGSLRWETRELDLDPAGVETAAAALLAWVETLSTPTLLKLRTIGQSGDEAAALLHRLETGLAPRLLYLAIERTDVPETVARGKVASVAAASEFVEGLLADLTAADAPAAVRAEARRLLSELVLETWP
jgi:DNA repair exonuclease SbcCD nuclease subunit